jgi:methionine sulfoxide reductase heme-binding subunit
MLAWTSARIFEVARAEAGESTTVRKRSRRKVVLKAAKLGTALVAAIPAARVGWLLAHDQLGANPIAEAMNKLGFWALTLLLASLAPTPVKILTGWTWPIALRRLLGLLAFGYAFLHFGVYLGVDQFFDFGEIAADIVKRKFITVGFAALVLLVPLAVTSTSGMLKRLGARRWKKLHRLVYLAAALGVLHFVWRVKSDLFEPLVMAAVLTALLAVRLGDWLRTRRSKARHGVRPDARPAPV